MGKGKRGRNRFLAAVGLALAAAILLCTGPSCAGSATSATVDSPTTTAFPATTAPASASTTVPQVTTSVPGVPTTAASTPTSLLPAETTEPEPSTTLPPLPPLIVLDPGHSGSSLTTIDPSTQIRDEEYRNTPETKNMFEVAVLLKAKLEEAGYRVLVTKQAWDDTVSKRNRVDFANQNGAALGVSIHTSGHTFGNYGEIYVQRMDSYREDIHGTRVYFDLPEVAELSAEYGKIFLEERRKIEGPSVRITVNTSWGGRGLAPGNLPIVQLFSEVPWLLNEAGVPQGEKDKERYAQSLFNSIVACVPLDTEGTASPSLDAVLTPGTS